MKRSKTLHMMTFTLLIIGGINWGLIGLLNWDVIQMIFSGYPVFEMIVYIAIGLSAIYIATTHVGDCLICNKA